MKRISQWPLENSVPLKLQPANTDTKQIISSLISNSHSFVDFLRKTCGEWRRSEFFQHWVKFGTLSFITVLFANCFCQVFIYLMALRNLQFLSFKSSKKENSHPFLIHWFNLKSWFIRVGHKLWNKCYTYSQVFRHLRKVLKGLAFSNVPFIQN